MEGVYHMKDIQSGSGIPWQNDLPPQVIELILNGEFFKPNPPQEQKKEPEDERE